MSNTSIQLKKSGQTGNIPPSLAHGEVALNYADGKLYYKTAGNVISYITNQYSFTTINVGGNLILATSTSDTLTLQAGNNISLTTDSLNNKITISSTGTALDQDARDSANAAFLKANAAYSSQNTTGSYANSAYNQANTATSNSDSASLYANGAFLQANAAFNKANTYPGNSNQILYKNSSNVLTSSSGLVYDGTSIKVNGNLESTFQSGDEGGEIFLNKSVTNTTLTTGVSIDVYQNKLRIFETGGSNRGVYIDMANGAAGGIGTNLLAPAGGAVTSVAGATGTVSNTQLIAGIQAVSSSYGITFDYVATANNGQGTNFKVGDDAWIGDYNTADSLKIKGQQNAANGYISFGSNTSQLGAAGSGQLTYGGNTVWHAGNDGSGSGLDADLLDGLNSSAFARVSAESYANSAFLAANTADSKAVTAGSYANSAYTQANTATTNAATADSKAVTAGSYANSAFTAANSAGSYANSAFAVANTDVTNISISSGTYGNSTIVPVITVAANGRITSVTNVAITASGGSGSYISSGTSNVYFSSTNGNIVANVAGNTALTVTANGLITSGSGSGDISGANNVYANTFIATVGATVAGVNVVPFLQSAFGQANAAYGSQNTTGSYANSAFTSANSAGSYANAAFTVANTDVTNVSITAGQYGNTTTVPVLTIAANGRITAVSNATISGGGGSGSYISSGTSNVYFSGANGNILANVSGNTIVTITANGITAGGTGGDISGANTIYANNIITTGTGGTITGANNIYSNTFIAANGVTIAGVNALPFIQSAFTQANSAYSSQNTTGTYANSAFAVANGASSNVLVVGSYANSAFTAANSAGSYANAAFTKANTAITTSGGTITGSLNISANLVVSGNLVVLGTESIINTTTLEIDDSLLYIAGNNYFSDVVDIGIIAHYNDGANAHTGIFRDAGLKEWIFFKGYTPEIQSNNLINIADPSFAYANVWASTFKGNVVANTITINNANGITFNDGTTQNTSFAAAASYANSAYTRANNSINANTGGTITGNLTVTGVTNLGAVANVRITGGTNGYVLSTDGSGNLSWVVQSGGGGGSGTDQYARDTANAAFLQANAAFTQANTGGGGGSSGSSVIAVDTYTANGAQTSFALSYSTSENNVIVNINGVLQLKSAYNVSGSIITFDGAPANNSVVEITTLTGTNLSYFNRTYTGNNVATTFAVTNGVSNSSLIVTENGVVQEPGVDYYISGANVIFTTAPSTGVKIGVRELASTAVVANNTVSITGGTYGNSTIIPVITVAANGIITAISNVGSSGISTGKSIAMAIVFGG